MARHAHSRTQDHTPDTPRRLGAARRPAQRAQRLGAAVTLAALAVSAAAKAEATAEPSATAPSAAAPAAAAPPPSLPWLMRPTVAGTTARLDSTLATFEGGSSAVLSASGSYRLVPDLAVGARLTGVSLDVEDERRFAFANPALSALWTPSWGLPVRFSFAFVAALPLGQGGSKDASPEVRATVSAGMLNRSAMDNALFQPSYATAIGGLGVSWNAHGVTLAAEATVLQLTRVYDVPSDPRRTNFTSGLHAGWSFWGPLNLSAELHYQQWLANPSIADEDPRRQQLTGLLGLRASFPAGAVKLRPGLSYSRPLDDPMAKLDYQLFQLDLPIVF